MVKKQKLRPGDIVGALTADNALTFEQIGKIQLSANWSYIAVQRDSIKVAFKKLSEGKT